MAVEHCVDGVSSQRSAYVSLSLTPVISLLSALAYAQVNGRKCFVLGTVFAIAGIILSMTQFTYWLLIIAWSLKGVAIGLIYIGLSQIATRFPISFFGLWLSLGSAAVRLCFALLDHNNKDPNMNIIWGIQLGCVGLGAISSLLISDSIWRDCEQDKLGWPFWKAFVVCLCMGLMWCGSLSGFLEEVMFHCAVPYDDFLPHSMLQVANAVFCSLIAFALYRIDPRRTFLFGATISVMGQVAILAIFAARGIRFEPSDTIVNYEVEGPVSAAALASFLSLDSLYRCMVLVLGLAILFRVSNARSKLIPLALLLFWVCQCVVPVILGLLLELAQFWVLSIVIGLLVPLIVLLCVFTSKAPKEETVKSAQSSIHQLVCQTSQISTSTIYEDALKGNVMPMHMDTQLMLQLPDMYLLPGQLPSFGNSACGILSPPYSMSYNTPLKNKALP